MARRYTVHANARTGSGRGARKRGRVRRSLGPWFLGGTGGIRFAITKRRPKGRRR